MCQKCLSPWGACGCPKADDSISACGCEKGVYCAVCGHQPNPLAFQAGPPAATATPGMGVPSVDEVLARTRASVDEILSRLRQQQPTPTPTTRRTLSGTYVGMAGDIYIEVRVDVDAARPLNLVSGDVFHLQGPGADAERVYSHSFICRTPRIERKVLQTLISGELSFFEARQEPTQIEVSIPSSTSSMGPATVKFINPGNVVSTFTCPKTSDSFRRLQIELDYLEGTELPRPVDTAAISPRPADLPAKTVTLQSAFADAGIDVQIPELGAGGPGIVPIPWQQQGEDGWSEAELHKLMEDYFSQYSPGPQWRLHLVVVNRSEDDPDWGGLMYDCIGDEATGTGYRQGAALFWDGLKNTVPPEQIWRYMLLSAVHELGHGLGLLHTFDPAKTPSPPYPNVGSASFMNYPMAYYAGGKAGDLAFLEKFRWEFDNAELVHLRHGELMKVIPGGVMDAAFQGHATFREAIRFLGATQDKGGLRLLISSRPAFEFTEPVGLDLYLSNAHPSEPRPAHAHLDPQEGLVQLAFCSPSGRIRYYQPLFRACAFKAKNGSLKAGAILHKSLVIAYGRNGFYFDEPGEYQVLGFYRTPDGHLVASNIHRFRVNYPDKDDERMAQDVFQPQAGKFLYLAGTDAYPATAQDLLELAERFPQKPVSGYIRAAWGMNLASPFKRLFGDKVEARAPQGEEAARFLRKALETHPQTQRPLLVRAAFRSAAQRLAAVLAQQGKDGEAKSTLDRLARPGQRFATDFSDDYPGGVPPHVFNRYYGRAWAGRRSIGEPSAEEMRRMQEEIAQRQKLLELQAQLEKAKQEMEKSVIQNMRAMDASRRAIGEPSEEEMRRMQEELAKQQKLLELQAQLERAKQEAEKAVIGNVRGMVTRRWAWWDEPGVGAAAAPAEGVAEQARSTHSVFSDTMWEQEYPSSALERARLRELEAGMPTRTDYSGPIDTTAFQSGRRAWVGLLDTGRLEERLRSQQKIAQGQTQLLQHLQSKGLLTSGAWQAKVTPQDVDKLIADCQKLGQEVERFKAEWQNLSDDDKKQRAMRDAEGRRQALKAWALLHLTRAMAPLRSFGWQYQDAEVTEEKVDDLLKVMDQVQEAVDAGSAERVKVAVGGLRRFGWEYKDEDVTPDKVASLLRVVEQVREERGALAGVDRFSRAMSTWGGTGSDYALSQKPLREQLMKLHRDAALLQGKVRLQQEHLNWMRDFQAKTLGSARSFRSWTVDQEKRRWAYPLRDPEFKDPDDPWRERWTRT